MIKTDKYLSRRHLEAYSEIKLSKFLENKGYITFFPFKDKIGVDMVAISNGGKNIELYQLKARNPNSGSAKGIYWFDLIKDIEKLSKLKNKRIFFILCALQENQKDFDFFKIPFKIAVNYFKQKGKTNKMASDLEIKKISEGNYKIMPYKIKNIDINSHKL